MAIQMSHVCTESTRPRTFWKPLRIAGACVWFGGLIGALCYVVGLPLVDIPFPSGIVLGFVFGIVIGIGCAPFVAVLLRTRDLATAKPLVFWTTAIITGGLAAFLPDRFIFHVMGLAAGVLLFMALVARLALPRVWEWPGHCRYCGYDVRASIEFGRCPECGNTFDRKPWYARRKDWHGIRVVALRVASLLFRYPSLVLVVLILGRLGPMVYELTASTARCRGIVPALEEAAARGGVFDLRRCTDFCWEQVYIAGPYTSCDDVETKLGVTWPAALRTDFMDESVNVLAFVHGRRVVACLRVPRHWDFVPLLVGKLVARDDAAFLVQEHGPGSYTLSPCEGQTTQP